ncbi:MAG: MBL fold metallo-hydrolase [Oscillospiraceae bacterium]|nr:MBL fold metallo-hydrolase [Oscillospiraceae bacterium]
MGTLTLLEGLGLLGILVFGSLFMRAKKRGRKKFPLAGLLASFLVCVTSFGGTILQPNGGWAAVFGPANAPAEGSSEAKAPTGVLKAHFLNVGQGDCAFIELPNGQTMLIDAGNPGDGENIVHYIKEKGYTKLDFLIATHPHADHIGGMAEVVKEMDIASVYMPKASASSRVYENLLNAIVKKGLAVHTAKAGVSLADTAGFKAYLAAPNGGGYEDLNNYSAVLKIVYKNNSFLFTGDAETRSENEITANVKADVLKVGHHGSKTSTGASFLQKVSPSYAVISVGAGNSYGHPAQTTLDKLKAIGAKTYRTDRDGTIVFQSDGTRLTVSLNSFATDGWVSSGAPAVETAQAAASESGFAASGNVSIRSVDKQAELVTIQNAGAASVDMTGWTLVSKTGNQRYTFPEYTLKAGAEVTVASGKAGGDLAWTKNDIWSNGKSDPAQLYNKQNQLVSTWNDSQGTE